MTVLENMQGYEDILNSTTSSKRSYSSDKKFPHMFHQIEGAWKQDGHTNVCVGLVA